MLVSLRSKLRFACRCVVASSSVDPFLRLRSQSIQGLTPSPTTNLITPMKANKCIPVILLGFLSFSCGQDKASQVIDLEPTEADKLLVESAGEIVVLDVRTPQEVAAGHIRDSININIHDKDFAERVKKLDPSKTYLVHCARGSPGGRSRSSVDVLLDLGATKVYHLNGGFSAWEKAGKPVETGIAK